MFFKNIETPQLVFGDLAVYVLVVSYIWKITDVYVHPHAFKCLRVKCLKNNLGISFWALVLETTGATEKFFDHGATNPEFGDSNPTKAEEFFFPARTPLFHFLG